MKPAAGKIVLKLQNFEQKQCRMDITQERWWRIMGVWLWDYNQGQIIKMEASRRGKTEKITITIALLIFVEKWHNYASGPKSAPNSESFWVCQLFNVCVRVFCAPNARVLLVYIPVNNKMSFIWKNDFFFLPKSASSVSRSQAHFPALFKRIHNHIRSAEGQN